MPPNSEVDERVAVLAGVVHVWDRVLDECDDLLVEPSLANIVTLLKAELESPRARPRLKGPGLSYSRTSKGLHSELSVLLSDLVEQADAGFGLLELESPGITAILGSTLSASQINTAQLIPLLVQALGTLDSPFHASVAYLTAALPKLEIEFLKAGSYEAAGLNAAMSVTARAALRYEDAGQLKKWLRRKLSGGSASVILEEAIPDLRGDDQLAMRLDTATREFAACAAAANLSRWAKLTLKREVHYHEIWMASEAVINCRRGGSEGATTLAIDLVRTVVASALTHHFTRVFGNKDKTQKAAWDSLDSLGGVLAAWLSDHGFIRTTDNGPGWDGVPRDSCSSFLIDLVARAASSAIVSNSPARFEYFGSWFATQVDASDTLDLPNVMWQLAGIETQAGLLLWRREAEDEIVTQVRRIFLDFADGRMAAWASQELWGRWEAKFATFAEASTSAWESVVWRRLADSQLRDALSGIADSLSVARPFDVMIPIGGAVSSAPGSWLAGKQRWYTRSSHSPGDRIERSPGEDTANQLVVLQRVEAPTPTAAFRRARETLEASLSALSFALSANSQPTGFRPATESWYVFGNPTDGSSGFHGQKDRTEFASRTVGADYIQRFSKTYASLTDRLADDRGLSELENRLLRALFWYRSGRWQPNATRRLLDHFVSLEHLFKAAGDSKDDTLANGVSKVFGSWLFRPYPFSEYLKHVLNNAWALCHQASISEDQRTVLDSISREPEFARWSSTDYRSNIGPWLSPGFVLAAISHVPGLVEPERWTSHVQQLQTWRDDEEAWGDDDGERASRAWFKVRFLAKRRHAIVHDALVHVPGIEHEANALTKMVEDVLRHLVDVTLSRPLAVTTMNDLVAELLPPWLDG